MKKYAKLLPLILIMFPLVVLAIGGTKRIIDLPGFTADRLLFVDSANKLQDSGITIGGSDNELSGIASLNGITSTTLGYLDATSSIQTQLDAKLDDFTSSTDNVLVRTNGTAGEAVQDSGVTLSDADAMSGVTQMDIINQGELRLQDTTGGEYVGLRANGTTTSYTLTMPNADGSSGQYLSTNGLGTLSWTTLSAGAVTVEAKTASFTAQTGFAYTVDTSLGDVTATLPAASGNSGNSIWFYIEDATNNLIIDGNSTETVEGSTIQYMNAVSDLWKITADGSNWFSSAKQLNGKVTASSSTFNWSTAGYASGEYAQMTGNSITLVPGTWELQGLIIIRGGTSTGRTFYYAAWGASNGNNTTSAPTGLTFDQGGGDLYIEFASDQLDDLNVLMTQPILTITTETTVYLVPRAAFSSAGTGTFNVNLSAKRLK